MKSKLLSISAVSAGFVAVFLLIGAYFEIADLFTSVISSVFVTLPLYYKSYKASFLAFLAGGVIAFMCSGFNLISLVFPAYFSFFGVYPIVKCILDKKGFNKYAGFILGLVWFVLIAFGLYYYYTLFMGAVLDGIPLWILEYIEIFIAIIAIIFFVIYNKFLTVTRRVSDYYLNKIIK